MPCADYRAIWRTNRTEIALFLPRDDDAQAIGVCALMRVNSRSQREIAPRLLAARR
jgi:hypothetical protein